MKKITTLLIIALFPINNLSVYATSWRTDANWCHNSKTEWYHCHSSWSSSSSSYYDYSSSYSSSYEEEESYMSEEELREYLKLWNNCNNLENSSNITRCNSLRNEWDIYEYDEIKLRLKENWNCKTFSTYNSNYKTCTNILNDWVYTIEELSEKTNNFNMCNNVRLLKKDYEICLEQKESNTEEKVTNIKEEQVVKNTEARSKKFQAIQPKIQLIINKDKKLAEKLLTQINILAPRVSNKDTVNLLYEIAEYIENELNTTDENNVLYKVISVSDWDTIKINYNWVDTTIRLIWVDTPESYTTRFWYKECYWDEASEYLKNLLEWKSVWIELDQTQWTTDKYWRLLAYVFLDWENINWKLISEWYWWEYTYNKAYKYQSEFKNNEDTADLYNKWLWSSNTCNWERMKAFEVEEETTKNVYDILNQSSNDTSSYSCSRKPYCSEIKTCAEAKFYLNSCGLNRLDRDSDWIPCESICWN